jgi:hypothetical protein
VLLELLAARFGPVPAHVSAQLASADEASLTRWTTRVLTAPTLEAVLGASGEQVPPTKPPPARKRARRA